MSLIKDLWRGDVSLVIAYWVFGVAVSVVLNALLLVSMNMVENPSGSLLFLLLWVTATVYGVFIAVTIWRSAGKYQGPMIWVVLARVMVVLSILRTLLNLTGAA